MAASKIGKLKLFLLLFPIPVFWAVFSELPIFADFYKPLEALAMDWRFRVRGPLDVPEVKIAYADLDPEAISELGEKPWSRLRFGKLAEILFELGDAKAVGYDIVFSKFTSSEMVPRENIRGSDLQFARFIRKYPNIVLAANYTGIKLPLELEKRNIDREKEFVEDPISILPLVERDSHLPEKQRIMPHETRPEMPSFPVIDINEGTVGLISYDEKLSGDGKPRWVPMFASTSGPHYTLNFLEGYKDFYETVTDESFEVFGENIFIIDSEGDHLASYPVNVDHTFYHLSIELALKYLGISRENIEITSDALTIRNDDGDEVIRAPLVEGQFTEVNWFSEWLDDEYNPRASIADIFQHYYNFENGQELVKEEAVEFFKRFNDAIVLVGPVDPILQDLAPTPFDATPVPKVGMHGNMIKTLFSGLYISRVDTKTRVIALFLLTASVSLLGLYSGRFSIIAKTGSVILLVGYVIAVFTSFSTLHLVIPLIAPVASAVTTTTAGALYQLFVEERQKGRITGMFGTYLSPELVSSMVESGDEPSLGGEDARITAFFSDVQSFSSFSELLEPDQLVTLMNEYLTAMTDILMQEGAYVDKYIGDAIVAMFNAPAHLPDHELRGCIAAAKIQKRQLELREKWATEGDKWPDIVSKMQTRIGLNTGNATVGNMGSESRFNYTMMGDTVNLAARCESGAKTAGVYSLVTAETMKAAKESGDTVLFRFVDKWQVQGRSKPVDMYEVVGLTEDLEDSTFECVKLYEAGLAKYFALEWDAALNLFERSSELEPNQPGITPGVKTNPSLVLLQRCKTLRQHPPDPNYWNGVYVMTTK